MNRFRSHVGKKVLIAAGCIFSTLIGCAADEVDSKKSIAWEKELIEIVDYAVPLDIVFQDFKDKKSYWPYSEPGMVPTVQIECIRGRFSSVEISAYKRKLITRYLKERGDEVPKDIAALRGGIAEAMRRFYLSIPVGKPDVDPVLLSVSSDPALTDLAKILLINQEAEGQFGFKRMITYMSAQAELACIKK